jgi:transposase
MLQTMEVVMIQQLAEQGRKIAQIAHQVGVDRKTVRRVLAAEATAKPSGRAKPSVLDPYKKFLRRRLEEADFTAQRLFQDIQQQGYPGSYVLVRRFVAPLRAVQAQQAVVRFETLPAQQAQVDWAGRFGKLVVDGVRQTVSCFTMVLGFSRYLYLEFTTSRNLVNFLGCHQRGFEYFGGVPQEVLYDNLKTAVLSHVDGVVEWQPVFADFAGCYGFRPRACRPYRPETKEKVSYCTSW